jgi:hypothetical protein
VGLARRALASIVQCFTRMREDGSFVYWERSTRSKGPIARLSRGRTRARQEWAEARPPRGNAAIPFPRRLRASGPSIVFQGEQYVQAIASGKTVSILRRSATLGQRHRLLTMYPDARRGVVRLLWEIEATERR